MENASKALAIAGSILIGIMIIAVLILMVNNIGGVEQKSEEQKRQEQILAFNKEYESYVKTLMRGTDVVTVINKANNNNLKTAYDSAGNIVNQFAQITTILKIEFGDIADKDGKIVMYNGEYVIGNYNMKVNNKGNKYNKNTTGDGTEIYDAVINDPVALKTFKRKFFKCTDITYNAEGIVNGMTFEEVEVGTIPGY